MYILSYVYFSLRQCQALNLSLLILLLAFLLELIVKMIASREMSGTRPAHGPFLLLLLIELTIGLLILLLAFLLELIVKMIASREMSGTRTFPPLNANRIINRFYNIAIIIPLRVNSKNDSKPGKCPAHVRHTDVRNTDPLFLLIKLLIGLLILLLAFLLELIVKMIASREMSGTRTFPPLNANRIIDRFINIAIIIPIRVNSKNDSKPGKCPEHVRHTDVRNTDPLPFTANKTIHRFSNIAISILIRANSKNDSKPGNVRHTDLSSFEC